MPKLNGTGSDQKGGYGNIQSQATESELNWCPDNADKAPQLDGCAKSISRRQACDAKKRPG